MLLFVTAVLSCLPAAIAQSVSRAEVLSIAETFVNHKWKATAANVLHGPDANRIEVRTPDFEGGQASPVEAGWKLENENVGVPYKWGGFDTPQSFDRGVRSGKAAGDLYSSDKRRLGGAAVSGQTVGIDCSGFVSRCWKLSEKHSTSMLPGISKKLPSASELLPGDVMNTNEGHVLLFVKWLNETKQTALFYEAAPFSKTLASEQEIASLLSAGYQPLRYRNIRD